MTYYFQTANGSLRSDPSIRRIRAMAARYIARTATVNTVDICHTAKGYVGNVFQDGAYAPIWTARRGPPTPGTLGDWMDDQRAIMPDGSLTRERLHVHPWIVCRP